MKEITLKAVPENAGKVVAFVDEQLKRYGCPILRKLPIDVAVDEIFYNICNYAYPAKTGMTTVGFEFDGNTRAAAIIFTDSGVPFNQLELNERGAGARQDQKSIGKLGSFIIKKSMDHTEYRYEGRKNILTIVNYI